ncbi:MAG: hypothetical protein V4726_16170 [Verrucomicrobiota bacterium]
MPVLPAFRHYCICQDAEGGTLELWRGDAEVACLAFDTRRQVLVELHVATGPAERQRDLQGFQNLLQLAAPLRHRHLLGIIEGGEDDGANYHITDFLDGERLDSWLKRLAPLPPWLALTVLLQVVEGLAVLASHPRLLAGVEVFHAGIMLTGDRVDELVVKICDLGLAGARPMSTEPQFVEARAIHEAGRLLIFMLTGSLPEGAVTAELLPENPDMEEVRFLLDTIFQAAAPHHPSTLEQLRTLVERCLHNLPEEVTAHPDKLPAALRPLLPLAAYLPGGEAVAEAAGEDCAVDTRPGDAAQPYRHRAIERATRHPVVVQVLPPPGMVPAEFFAPLADQAWAARTGGDSPHLLKLRGWNAGAQPPVLVEELPGKWTLDSIVRLRQRLEPAEVLILLKQLDAAADAAAAMELPLHWRSPRLVPVQFTAPGSEESLATAGKLARLPMGEWPAFRLKVRTWPLMLNFTQPERFQLDRLMPRETGLPVDSGSIRAGILTPPTARDFALLAVWMMGGTGHLREQVKPLIYETLHAKLSAGETRREFLERFRQRVEAGAAAPAVPEADAPDKGPGPAAAAAAAGGEAAGGGESGVTPPRPVPPVRPQQPALSAAPPGRRAVKRARRGAPRQLGVPGTAAALAETGVGASTETRIPAEAGSGDSGGGGGLFSQAAVVEEQDKGAEAPAMGFAEALFGGASPARPEPPAGAHRLFGGAAGLQDHDDDNHGHDRGEGAGYDPEKLEIPEGAPLGFMEAAGQQSNFMNGPGGLPGVHLPPRRSPWMLVLVVVLISAAIAALMAELSGRAVWHR